MLVIPGRHLVVERLRAQILTAVVVQQLGVGLQAGLPLTVADDLHPVGGAVVVAFNGAPATPDDQVVTLGNTQRRDGGGGALKRRRAGKPDGRISGRQGRTRATER